jgi:hypothetical protein
MSALVASCSGARSRCGPDHQQACEDNAMQTVALAVAAERSVELILSRVVEGRRGATVSE